MQIAQTNIQLYNQLREKGIGLDDLTVVRRAYELSTQLYTGFFQGDGKPFVAHSVGVASILAELGQPAETLAVGLLHNVYGNGDFGDGRRDTATPERRRLVRAAMGDRIERLVARFPEVRIQWRPIAETHRRLPDLDDRERTLILVDLADYLEKYVDLGILYYPPGHNISPVRERIGSDLVDVATRLGQPRLADMLRTALAAAESARHEVPGELRPSGGRSTATLLVPMSCRRRPVVKLRATVGDLRARVRLRTRLRKLIGASGRRATA